MRRERTQVAIVGGGPAGLLLGQLLTQAGIDNVILERQSKSAVLRRIRAGVLESHSVDILRASGLRTRMDDLGMPKNGAWIVWQNRPAHFIDIARWTGRQMMAYGQTMLTEDLYAARAAAGSDVLDEAEDVALHGIDGPAPHLTYRRQGQDNRLDCDFVAGCDGFHGPSRPAIPSKLCRVHERSYPFGWLGIMVERPPLPDITYARHAEGFAMASRRTPMLSRYYVQAPISDSPEDWSDDRFWDTLLRRFPPEIAARIETGPSIEKSMAPLRSFVTEPMQYGRLYLAGDAGHIVPPTGAKGLNLAISDVYFLSRGLIAHYAEGTDRLLNGYSAAALRRIWAAQSLSSRLTRLLHVYPDDDAFTSRLVEAEYETLLRSETAQAALAHDYAGLPYLG